MSPETAESKTAAPAAIRMLHISRIHDSPSNPRKTFDEASLTELAATIRAQGILQPVVVRPAKAAGGAVIPMEFELVVGHRRVRAAKVAELTEVPALIREMTDQEALEAQLVENATREDIPALEEAEALERLHKHYGYTVETIAEKTGKSKGSIYARLKLCTLGPEGRKALQENLIDWSLALIVARIPDVKLQAEATREIVEERMSVREAQEFIHREYMLELKKAPFDPKDPNLCAAAGACVNCPKRTKAQPDLFEDVKGKDLCTDPKCYREKVDAQFDRERATAKVEGRKVLSDAESKRIFYQHGGLAYEAPYVDADSVCHADPKGRTYEELLGKKALVLAKAPTGGMKALVPKDELAKLLKDAGHKFDSKPMSTGNSDENRKREKEAKRRDATGRLALEAIVAAHVKRPQTHDGLWRFLFGRILSLSSQDAKVVIGKRRGLVEKADVAAAERGLKKLAAEFAGAELEALVVELSIAGEAKHSQWSPGYSAELKEVCEAYGVDFKKLDAQTKADAKAKATPGKLPVCKGYDKCAATTIVRIQCKTRVPSTGSGHCTRCTKAQAKEDAKMDAPKKKAATAEPGDDGWSGKKKSTGLFFDPKFDPKDVEPGFCYLCGKACDPSSDKDTDQDALGATHNACVSDLSAEDYQRRLQMLNNAVSVKPRRKTKAVEPAQAELLPTTGKKPRQNGATA